MPGYDEETVRKSRQDQGQDDPDRQPRRMDRGPSLDAGATQSLGIRPVDPADEGSGAAGDLTGEELLEDR